MGKALPLIIIGLLIIVVVAFLLMSRDSEMNFQDQMPPDEPTQSNSTTDLDKVTPEGYERYSTDDFSILFHEDMDMPSTQGPNDSVSFMLSGPTQTENTELFDGINITVTPGTYQNDSFEDFVASEMEEIENEGISEVTSEMTDVVIGDKSGYEFTTEGLGEFRQIYFNVDDNEYIHVSVFVEDPEDQGYENIAEEMLQSLSF